MVGNESELGLDVKSAIVESIVSSLSKSVKESGEFESVNVIAPFIKKMNSDSAYSDVPNDECVDPNHDYNVQKEIKDLIKREEERPTQNVVEKTLSKNLGTEDDPKLVQIGSTLSSEECKKWISLLKELKVHNKLLKLQPFLARMSAHALDCLRAWFSLNFLSHPHHQAPPRGKRIPSG